MQDEEIRERIAGLPRWHYRFDLKGNLTPIFKKSHLKRHAQRKKHFFDPLVGLFEGALEDKRLLDLGGNALALLAGVVERAPPALQASLDAVGSGQPLRFSLYV